MNLLSDQVDLNEVTIIVRELNRILDMNIDGDVVEFGCYLGTTSVFLARELKQCSSKKLYVYDSFEGLPEKTFRDSSPLGESFKTGELFATKKDFIKNMKRAGVPMPIIKKAWFADLLHTDVPKRVCFAFLDGDYYQSIIDSFRLIEGSLVSGATIIVDDYGNDALPGAARAVNEWMSRHRTATLKVEHSLAIIYLS